VLVSFLTGSIYGFNSGVISGLVGTDTPGTKQSVVSLLIEDPSVQDVLTGALTASIVVGAIGGAYGGVVLAQRIGRKKTLGLCGLLCLVFALLLAVPNLYFILAARTLLGLSVGGCGVVGPMYVNEVATPAQRGRLGSLFQISVCFTIMLAQLSNYLFHPDISVSLSEMAWRVQFAMGAIPGLLLLLYSFIVPESPKYSPNSSAKILLSESQGEADIASLMRQEPKGFFHSSNIKWIAVGMILPAANQLTGINAVIFYAPKIFASAGLEGNPLLWTFALVGTWNFLSVFVSFLLVDRLGRRPLILFALALMASAALLFSIASREGLLETKIAQPLEIAAILSFILAFEIGPGPLFFVMATEAFPKEISKSGLSFTNGLSWIFNLLVSFGFPILKSDNVAGISGTFLVFAGAGYVACLLIFLLLPETKVSKTDPTNEET
jgi:sugar porter (SP) family MFS transporter